MSFGLHWNSNNVILNIDIVSLRITQDVFKRFSNFHSKLGYSVEHIFHIKILSTAWQGSDKYVTRKGIRTYIGCTNRTLHRYHLARKRSMYRKKAPRKIYVTWHTTNSQSRIEPSFSERQVASRRRASQNHPCEADARVKSGSVGGQATLADPYREHTGPPDWLIDSTPLGTTAHTRTDSRSYRQFTYVYDPKPPSIGILRCVDRYPTAHVPHRSRLTAVWRVSFLILYFLIMSMTIYFKSIFFFSFFNYCNRYKVSAGKNTIFYSFY